MDNGAFIRFDERRFLQMIERFGQVPGCRFVTAPDRVGDAKFTLQRWPFWSRLLRGLGYIPAFVAQDGLTIAQTPWPEIGVLFIGGTTVFKEGPQAAALCAVAAARGIPVHWGRVNTRRRLRLALAAGANSIDGTGCSRWPHTNIPILLRWIEEIRRERLPVERIDWP